ncbi:MAG: hypothetical protein H6Q60_4 [Oscillospiraceae bacterium]|nr:hypothetical protein [Oscillospiraceae bacterium]
MKKIITEILSLKKYFTMLMLLVITITLFQTAFATGETKTAEDYYNEAVSTICCKA